MRVLVTRTENDLGNFLARISALGCTPIPAPMIDIERITEPPFNPDLCQAVITTSGHGVRALSESTDRRDFLIFTVGPASGKLAESLGFTNIKVASGTGKALVGFIRRSITPIKKPLVYFRADVIQVPIGQDLKRSGFNTIPRIAYRTIAAETLPEKAKAAFDAPTPPEVVVFMSIRGFRLFRACLENAGLLDKVKQMTAVTISTAVSDFARELPWKRVVTAEDTNGEAILDAISTLKEQAQTAN